MTLPSFSLRQDEPGAINYLKNGSWSWFLLKDQEPIFQDQEPSQNSRNICFSIRTVSVAVYGYRTHWFRRRILLYNQNEAYNSVTVYGYGTNSPWNGSVAVQNRPAIVDVREFPIIYLCKLVVHYLHV